MDCQPRGFSHPTPPDISERPAPDDVLRFGPFTFHVRQRLVTRDGEALRLGGRALDILQILVEHAGEIVDKQALIARVWPDSVVEEINLRVQIAALRRVLDGGQRYIETLAQRGYRFKAPVHQSRMLSKTAAVCIPNNLPVRLNQVIGREDIVGKLVRQLPARRFITLIGAGGVGKSTVACRVAERLVPHYPDGVCVVDFSIVDSEQALMACLARLLKRDGPYALASLFDELATGRRLLVFDNCEALLEHCRHWVDMLLAQGSELAILATSRQPLNVRDEQLYRLEPLAVPPSSAQISVEQGLGYSAVQLFFNRAQACQQTFVLQDRDMKIVGDICRKLDGLPLAIELAAAQINAFAVVGLHARLSQCVHWLTQGRRTAVSRHQSLRASLDWSHQRLSLHEQAALRRLAVFDRGFTSESAVDVIGCDGQDAQSVRDSLVQLERHSLLSSAQGVETARYRLPHTVRLFALEKLEHSGELQTFAARHARHLSLQRWLTTSAQSMQLVE
ncbi:transcriptional regulator [Pseudomonas syringae]|uniref:ATP-binding protein n=1 Tax=Pseudomonas syringae TaxID=317 RepID=UPI001F29AE0D|nr:winged helix-turn-helix domain-containing protein [Pseudomonas syringae]MCF5707252.1 transcriptional regulator [Pseudomonas syringae]